MSPPTATYLDQVGYCIHQTADTFYLAATDRPAAKQAINALGPAKWVDSADGAIFEQALEAWRWEAEHDEDENVVGINFTGEKAGDDLYLFKAIAPWVKEGSFIEMCGEDGERWRWIFDGKTCVEKHATVTF